MLKKAPVKKTTAKKVTLFFVVNLYHTLEIQSAEGVEQKTRYLVKEPSGSYHIPKEDAYFNEAQAVRGCIRGIKANIVEAKRVLREEERALAKAEKLLARVLKKK
jgi:hypothetical protein